MSFCGVMVWTLILIRIYFSTISRNNVLNKSLCWFCNEVHHGKVPMDYVIFRKVKSGQFVVHTPKEFSDAAIKFVSSIITVSLPRSDEIVKPDNIHQAPSISETLLIHKFVRQINDRGDCSIEFFKTAVNQEAFHIQWYKRASDNPISREVQ